jgi:hypothetical protein
MPQPGLIAGVENFPTAVGKSPTGWPLAAADSTQGLALALVRVGAASGAPLSLSRATAHLFFVEPSAPETGWWDRGVMSHPTIEARVAALAQMGSGIAPEAIARAREAGERFRTGSEPSLGRDRSPTFGSR